MSVIDSPPSFAAPGPPTRLCSVLRRLGHTCDGDCVATDPSLGAARFAWRSMRLESALLVVDVSPEVDALSAHRLLQRLNTCTRPQIRVIARQPDDRGRALALLSSRPLVSA